jgi:hypothetical protein
VHYERKRFFAEPSHPVLGQYNELAQVIDPHSSAGVVRVDSHADVVYEQ